MGLQASKSLLTRRVSSNPVNAASSSALGSPLPKSKVDPKSMFSGPALPRRPLRGARSAPNMTIDEASPAVPEIKEGLPANTTLPAPSPPGQTVKRTYAQMRTIRQEKEITKVSEILGTETQPELSSRVARISPYQVKESYSEMRCKLGLQSDGSDAEGEGDNNLLVCLYMRKMKISIIMPSTAIANRSCVYLSGAISWREPAFFG